MNISLYNATRNTKKENWQQEIRLSSDFDGPFNFTAGAVIAEETFWFSAHQTIGLQWFFGVPDYIHDDYVNDQAHQARKTTGVYFDFPIIADIDMKVSKLYGMLQPNESETAAVRAVFFIDPSKKIRLVMYYPLNVGRNMDEILRALEALQTSDKYKVAMPLDWKKVIK